MNTQYFPLPRILYNTRPYRLMKAYDQPTERHAQRTAKLIVQWAKALGVPKKELTYWREGGLLHDIGKEKVPSNILNKPGPLTDEERAIMQQHPEYGYEKLTRIKCQQIVLDITLFHHERWDGNGYPYGLQGDEIPLSARIFALVDVWDALISDRPYRPAWSVDRICDYIRSQCGKHFDPHITEFFLMWLPSRRQTLSLNSRLNAAPFSQNRQAIGNINIPVYA